MQPAGYVYLMGYMLTGDQDETVVRDLGLYGRMEVTGESALGRALAAARQEIIWYAGVAPEEVGPGWKPGSRILESAIAGLQWDQSGAPECYQVRVGRRVYYVRRLEIDGQPDVT